MPGYDVVVCGAGPAGATAARYLAKAGLKTALVDRDKWPRDKPCGGALRPAVLEDFDYVRAGASKFIEATSLRGVMYNQDHSLHLDLKVPRERPIMHEVCRVNYDNHLKDFALDAGAEFLDQTKVTGVAVQQGAATVQLSTGKELRAPVVLGATGCFDPCARLVRKHAGLPETWDRDELGVVVEYEFPVGDRFLQDRYDGDLATSYLHLRPKGMYGYAWSFPKREVLNVGFGAYWKEMRGIDVKETFDWYLRVLQKAGLFPDAIPSEYRYHGANLPLRGPIGRTYMDHIMVLGDAAGFVTPLGGEGIYLAMRSGRLAAEVAAKAIDGGDTSEEALAEYEKTWRRAWGGDLKAQTVMADRLADNVDRVFRYASRDPQFLKDFADVYSGYTSAEDMLGRFSRRFARDFVLYDLFRL